MRGLLALVIGMGVLIVAGVAIIAVTIVHRLGAGAVTAGVVLDEPAGTRMVGISPDGNRLAVLLSGGGADRIVLLGADGRVVGQVTLRR
jgi:hypothetical protein